MTPWYEGPLSAPALDAFSPPASPAPPAGPPAGPSPGTDPELDRLGAAAVALQQAPGAPVVTLSPPGGPADASGRLAYDVARSLVSRAAGRPLVVLHAPYDLTLLDRELRRHSGTTLCGCLGGRSMCVIDPLLLDCRLGRASAASAGRRALAELWDGYDVPAPAGAAQDRAAAALELARAVGRRFATQLAGLAPAALHTLQAVWFAAEARGAAAWFACGARSGTDHMWPLRPAAAA